MSNSASDSFRNVTRYQGQDYRFVPTYLRPRDPISPTNASPDVKPKENQGYYPISSLWTTTTNQNVWVLAGIVNNLANWVLISSGGIGPIVKIGVPLGTSPITPDVNGLVNFTSTGGTVQITGSAGGTGLQNINFDITGGSVALERLTGDDATFATPSGSPENININGDANFHAAPGGPLFTGSGSTLTCNLTTALASPTQIGTTTPNLGQFTGIGIGIAPSTAPPLNMLNSVNTAYFTRITNNGTAGSAGYVSINDLGHAGQMSIGGSTFVGVGQDALNISTDGTNGLNIITSSNSPISFLTNTGGGASVNLSVTPTGLTQLGALGGLVYNTAGGLVGGAANTLSAYEQGTFTANMVGSAGGTATMSTTLGRYTRLGRNIFVDAVAIWTAAGTAAGNIQVSLPFTSSTIAGILWGNPWQVATSALAPGAGNVPAGYINSNSGVFNVNVMAEATGIVTALGVVATGGVTFNCFYEG